MKKALPPIMFALLILISIIAPSQGQAHSEIEEINQQLVELKKQKGAAEKKAKDALNRTYSINKQQMQVEQDINQIFKRIDEASQEITEMRTTIDKTEKKLSETEEQLAEAVDRVSKRDDLLGSRLRFMYMNGTVSYLEVLLNANSFTDFLDRFNALKSLVEQDKQILESNKKDQQFVADKKREMESLIASLTEKYEEAAKARENLFVQEKKKEVVIASLNQEEKSLG